MKSLLNEEGTIIETFAKALSHSARKQLLADAACATIQSVSANKSRITFEISNYPRPTYRGQHSFGVDGKMLDGDNAELSVCLYADENGRLLELEYIRWDMNDIINPQWNTFIVNY